MRACLLLLAALAPAAATAQEVDARSPNLYGTRASPVPLAGTDTVEVVIEALKFQHERVVIRPGTVIIWRNHDPVAHTVTADAGTFDSTIIPPGGSWAHVLSESGDHPYHCAPHPFMKAVVEVRTEETP